MVFSQRYLAVRKFKVFSQRYLALRKFQEPVPNACLSILVALSVILLLRHNPFENDVIVVRIKTSGGNIFFQNTSSLIK